MTPKISVRPGGHQEQHDAELQPVQNLLDQEGDGHAGDPGFGSGRVPAGSVAGRLPAAGIPFRVADGGRQAGASGETRCRPAAYIVHSSA